MYRGVDCCGGKYVPSRRAICGVYFQISRVCGRTVRRRRCGAAGLRTPLGRTCRQCSSVNCQRRATRSRGHTRVRCRQYGSRCRRGGGGLARLCSLRGRAERGTLRCTGDHFGRVCQLNYRLGRALTGCMFSRAGRPRRPTRRRPGTPGVRRRILKAGRARCFGVRLLSLVRMAYIKRRFRGVSRRSFCAYVGLLPDSAGPRVEPERGVHAYCLVFLVDRGLPGRSERG